LTNQVVRLWIRFFIISNAQRCGEGGRWLDGEQWWHILIESISIYPRCSVSICLISFKCVGQESHYDTQGLGLEGDSWPMGCSRTNKYLKYFELRMRPRIKTRVTAVLYSTSWITFKSALINFQDKPLKSTTYPLLTRLDLRMITWRHIQL
jgi:hypothetical protein